MKRISAAIEIGFIIGLITLFYTLLTGASIAGLVVLAVLPAVAVRLLGKLNFHKRAIPVYTATAVLQLLLLASYWIIPDIYGDIAMALSGGQTVSQVGSTVVVAPLLTIIGLALIYGHDRFRQ